jgi:hypothetical protein
MSLEQDEYIDPPIQQQSMSDILIGVKNTWFGILDDILAGDFNLRIFTRSNRLFYIGITLIVVAILLFLYNYFTEKREEKVITIEKHYIYENKPNEKLQ